MQLPAARFARALFGIMVAALVALAARGASAEALLLIEADSGKVLHAENATHPWYPASVTKLMTAYVTLSAMREGRIAADTLLAVSANAVAQQPSKMGFQAGTRVSVDNALKMMMVKSANDMAVVLAEGVGGSIGNFANEMNRAAQRLGMTQSSFVNPNGLPAENQVTSARDLAILARALISEFPEDELYWRISAIRFGKRVMHNYNPLIDRYPGADGMKTGFICSSGFNLVATATRGNKRLIAVVLGAPSGSARAQQAALLLEKGFAVNPLSWLTPSLGTVDALAPIAAEPPDLHEQMCGKHRHRGEADEEAANESDPTSAYAAMGHNLRADAQRVVLGPPMPSMPPIEVFVGSARKRPQLAASPSGGGSAGVATPAAKKPAATKKPAAVAAPSSPKPQARPGS